MQEKIKKLKNILLDTIIINKVELNTVSICLSEYSNVSRQLFIYINWQNFYIKLKFSKNVNEFCIRYDFTEVNTYDLADYFSFVKDIKSYEAIICDEILKLGLI